MQKFPKSKLQNPKSILFGILPFCSVLNAFPSSINEIWLSADLINLALFVYQRIPKYPQMQQNVSKQARPKSS